jgi:hypothetical protein
VTPERLFLECRISILIQVQRDKKKEEEEVIRVGKLRYYIEKVRTI